MIRTFLSSLTKCEPYERMGYAALLTALLLAFALRYLLALQTSSPVVIEEVISSDFTVSENLHPKRNSMLRSDRKDRNKDRYFNIPNGAVHVNKLSEEAWVKMGFSAAQAAAINRFRTSLGGFSSLQQMKKCFVMNEAFLHQGRGRFVFDSPGAHLSASSKDSLNSISRTNLHAVIPLPRLIDLNSADTDLLQSLKGVGPYWAKRIFGYKEKLGGFLHCSQLLEIEGMDSVLFQTISPLLVVDTSFIYRIPINKVSAHKLQQHPYFGKNLAVALVNYRERHGPFRNSGQLRNCLLVDHQIFRKIVPYLSFSE